MSGEATPANSSGTSIAGGNLDELNSAVGNNSNRSFAMALKSNAPVNFVFPNRDQAIVFDAVENTVKDDYIISVGELVNPENVIFASRVSNNRVCIYLSSKDIVEKFISTHGGVNIGGNFIVARRLVSPAKRVILSNVSPCLPHDIIEKHLKQVGLKVVSSINFIKAGISHENFKHVLSFRRQVYIILDKENKLPDSLLIEFKENAFRIFLTTDEIRCFTCKKLGHIASKCTRSSPESSQTNAVNIETPTVVSVDDKKESTMERIFIVPPAANTKADRVSSGKKRQAPPSTTSSSETGTPLEEPSSREGEFKQSTSGTEAVFIKPRLKKKRQESFPDDSSSYSQFKEIFDENIEVMDFDNLCKFLDEAKGKQNAIFIAKTFTDDIESLLDLLARVVRVVKANGLKSRIKRVIKKIKKELNPGSNLSQDDSECTISQGYSSEVSEY